MHIFGLELRTADWPRLVAWYRDVVGLRSLVRMTFEQYALLAGNDEGAVLAILGRPETAYSASSRWNLVLETDDLDALRARLLAAGVECPEPRRHPEGYRELSVLDPDQNRVRFFAWPAKN